MPRVAVVLSAVNMRRMIPGWRTQVESGRGDYWLLDIHRPMAELRRLMQDWRPAGLITEWLPGVTEHLLELGLPTVVAPADVTLPGVGSVDVDDAAVGRLAAEHFLDRGFRHFAFLGNRMPYSSQREAGFRAALGEAGVGLSTFYEEADRQRRDIEHWHEADPALARWIEALPKPVGVLAAHDPLGRVLAEACRAQGRSIPEDLAVLGVNNDAWVCGMTHPPLSSIIVPWDRVGFAAAQQIEAQLAQPRRKRWTPVLIAPEGVADRRSTDLLAVESPRLRAALRHIRDHACDGLLVKDLVAYLKVSRRSLETEFQAVLHRSPRAEIQRVRLTRAAALLRGGRETLDEIAQLCGFGTPQLFSANFKAHTGESPAAYRRARR